MWNYVQMDDGTGIWWMPHGDDVGTPPSSRYLLVGRATKGQYITIGEDACGVYQFFYYFSRNGWSCVYFAGSGRRELCR